MRPALLTCVLLLSASAADAATTCLFEASGTTLHLRGDCTTDSTLLIPDGFTIAGDGFTIAATDPIDGHFTGAVVMNGGSVASIVDTHITTLALADVCDSGPARFRGIFFDGAAGTIRGNTVTDITQGDSRCQEGNAIEVRSMAPRPATTVEIDHNVVERFQKTGIVVTGEVDAWVHDNRIGPSVNQERVAANGIQVGYGAWAFIAGNTIAGNSWGGGAASRDVATAVLLFRAAPATVVRGNTVAGNSDIGIYIMADESLVDGNEITDDGPDRGAFDIGIADYGVGNRITGNAVRGFRMPYDAPAGERDRTVALKLEE